MLLVVALGGVTTAAASPDDTTGAAGAPLEGSLQSADSPYERELLAKAAPDECYNGIGAAYPPGPPCEDGIPKVNQAYVWGLAKAGDQLWFGTAANVHCAVIGSYLSTPLPHESDSWVCEFGESQYSPPLPEAIGDWRPTHVYMYDMRTRTLTEKTPADGRILVSLGLRSAGAHNGVVILGGPSLLGGIDLFAYNTGTGEYLGSTKLSSYNNIRKWVVAGGVMYTAVRDVDGSGHVLRWTGNLADPFQFEEVGNLGSEGAELAVHEGRLFVSTWPYLQAVPVVLAGIYMSPVIPPGGLTAADAGSWQKVWQSSDYEPDAVTAATYGGGALASYQGDLYWGTMHVPFVAALAHFNVYGAPENNFQAALTVLNTHRAITIFRGRGFGTPDQQVELLYGSQRLTTYTYDPAAGSGSWGLQPNNMNSAPLWGRAGIDNFYNNYTWTMSVYDNQLFIGTMDWGYLFFDGLGMLLQDLFGNPDLPETGIDFPDPVDYGADLFRVPSAQGPAVAESVDGMGNFSNYGIRTMISADALYLGSANPMNLMTDPDDDLPEGGWELLRLWREIPNTIYMPWVRR